MGFKSAELKVHSATSQPFTVHVEDIYLQAKLNNSEALHQSIYINLDRPIPLKNNNKKDKQEEILIPYYQLKKTNFSCRHLFLHCTTAF